MIIKLMERQTAQGASSAAALVRYVKAERPQDTDDGKADPAYGGSEGFGSEPDTAWQIMQLQEQMARCPACRQPLVHAMIAWDEGERPTTVQAEEAVAILSKELGLDGLPKIWAAHVDTQHFHLHVLASRIDPETGTPRSLGMYKRRSQRAKAKIEALQGLEPCLEDMYVPAPGGGIMPNPERGKRKKTALPDAPDLPPLRQGTAAMEQRTGVQSAQSTAQETVPAILEQAKDWQSFHTLLSEASMTLRPAPRGGFVFTVNGIEVKSSSVMRKCGKKLEAKFGGPYEPPAADVPAPAPAPAEPAPAAGMDEELEPFWLRYLTEKEAWQAESRRQAKQAREEWKARMAAVVEANRVARKQMKAEIRLATRLVKKARRQSGRLHAGTEVALRLALEERGRARLRPLPAQGRSGRPAFPSFASWLDAIGEPALASIWRHRGSMASQPAPVPEEPEEDFSPRPGL